ncbi:MAG: S9 family peptidase, partial [Flavobacteriaceae bacterium]|nr:S9 family peptidase [Flavobacteriaceae bacterium]
MQVKVSKFLIIIASLSLAGCNNSAPNTEESMQYPETQKVDAVDVYFGKEIKDPYRWLENDRSEETAAWVKAQNKVTEAYMSQISYRDSIENKIAEIWNYEKIGAPFTEGNFTYFYKNDGLQNQYVLYRYAKDSDMEQAEVFIDPNTFSKDGTTSLSGINFSDSGKYAAYQISEGGSDWRKVLIMETESKKIIEDTLYDVKFSGLSWNADEGFYYSSYDKPDGSELSAKTDQHKLYYHKLGDAQSQDAVIFGATEAEKHRYVSGIVSRDNRFLYVYARKTTYGGKLMIKDLSKPKSNFVTIVNHYDSDTSV